MPYIDQESRHYYQETLLAMTQSLSEKGWKKGDFNYCVSMLLQAWIIEQGYSYDNLSNITGVLNDIKTEFERQVVAKYEDMKIQTNGHVYATQIPKK